MTQAERQEGHLETIASIRAQADQRVGHHQRLVERLAQLIGRPLTLYLLLAVVAVWVALNLSLQKPLDPWPFFALQGALGFYAALATTIVLTAQNRQQKHSEQKSYLELQVNLSSEEKAAKIIGLLEELRRDMPNVTKRRDSEAEQMSQAVDTRAVFDELERRMGIDDAAPGSK
ncbi:MAG: hypothetical protein JWP97_1563 [Labilithrix sp.]|nr:hypothetical protein [Labilithrix sp.]